MPRLRSTGFLSPQEEERDANRQPYSGVQKKKTITQAKHMKNVHSCIRVSDDNVQCRDKSSSSGSDLSDFDDLSSESDDDIEAALSKVCDKGKLCQNLHSTESPQQEILQQSVNSQDSRSKKESTSNTSSDLSSELFVIDKKGETLTPAHYQSIASGSKGPAEDDLSDSDTDYEFPVESNQKSQDEYQLSSSLQHNIDTGSLYVDSEAYKHPRASAKMKQLKQKSSEDELMSKSVVTGDFEKKHSIPPYQETMNQLRKQRKKERDSTKGKGWFNLPAPEMTEEKKNDLMVLQMRKVLDPKQFYKNPDLKVLPKYFQMGTVVEDAADFYNSRIPKKQRKATLVDELLADAEFRNYNKRKYMELQESQGKGKGAHRHMKRLKKRKK